MKRFLLMLGIIACTAASSYKWVTIDGKLQAIGSSAISIEFPDIVAGWTNPMADQRIVSYQMENDRGTVPDDSLYGIDGSLLGDMSFVYSGLSYDFDGTDNYISIADADSLSPTAGVLNDTPISFVCWVNMNNATNFACISKWDDGVGGQDREYYFGGGNSGILFVSLRDKDADSINQIANSSLNPLINTWIQLAGTYDGGMTNNGIILYTNGVVLPSTASDIGVYDGITNTTVNVFVGSFRLAVPLYSDGDICQARMYKRVLSQAELQTLFALNRTNEVIDSISTNNLVLYEPMQQDDNVRDYGIAGISGYMQPSWADGIWTLDGTNVVANSVLFGRLEHSEFFDGTSDHIMLEVSPALDITNKITFSAWIYPTALISAGLDMIIGKYDGGSSLDDSYLLFVNDSSVQLFIRDVGGGFWHTADTGVALPLNIWTHVVGVYNGVNVLIYTNGLLADTGDAYAGFIKSNPSEPMSIGADSDGDNKFTGFLDVVEIYSNALTATQISNLWWNTGGQNMSLVTSNRNEVGYNYENDL